MKTARFVLVMGLVAAAACIAAYASGTTRSEEDKMKTYAAGSSAAFAWVAVQDGVIQMDKLKMPGMVYYYNPNDNVSAYMWEVKVFDCPQFSTLKDKFIIMRIDSTEKAEDVKIKIPRNGTGVLFLDCNCKKLKDVSRAPSPSLFSRLYEDAVKKNNDMKKKEAEKK